jgi:hypothetical protein
MGAHTTFTLEDIQSVTGVKTFPTGTLAAVSPVLTGTDSGAEILTNKTIVGGLAGIGPSAQVFTSNGTFTIPPGITKLRVTVVGGGGAGGGGVNAGAYGAGGGSGGLAIKFLSGLTPGNTLTVTIGAAGAGAAGNGGSGGNSSVTSGTQVISAVTANGGSGGVSSGSFASGGTGGTATGGDLNMTGNAGGATFVAGVGGAGAASVFGGQTVNPPAVPVGGQTLGSGGSGAGNNGSTNNGGTGSAGIVIFEWVN